MTEEIIPFGEEMSDQKALEKGTGLIRPIEIIYKSMTEDQFDLLQKRRKETGDI